MSAPLLPPKLGRLGARELLIHETFSSIQGESSFAGRPCFFIRLTGCHLRCVWCDSEYAFFEGETRSVDSMLALAAEAGLPLVEVTGGEPLLQRAVYPLLAELADAGHEVLLETSGAVPIDRVDPRVRRIVDWKPPASGMAHRNAEIVLDQLRPGDELKLVLASAEDYVWARDWLRSARGRRFPESIPVHFAPVHGRLESEELARRILADRLPVRLNLQLHKIIWSPDARGV